MKVAKWGNSLAIRLPKAVVNALQINDGDNIEVEIADARVFRVSKTPGHEELLKRARQSRGKLPADFKLSLEETNER